MIRGVLRAPERPRLVLGTLALVALRLILALFRDGPVLVADEAGYLLNARALTGGTPGELRLAPFYRGGYSLVIAPVVALHADPRTVYRLVLVVNAMLAASLAPLLYLMLVRFFRVPRRPAVWIALTAAAYPSVTAFSQVALSENLLLPLTVVWLLVLGALLEAPSLRSRTGWALALGACSAALYAVHGRMIVAAAIAVAALLLLAVSRRLELLAAVAGLAVAALGLAGVHALDRFLETTNYGGRSPNEVGDRLATVRDLGGVLSVIRNLVGQAWYVVVATLGLAVLAAVTDAHVDVRRLLDRWRRCETDAGAFLLLVLLVLGVGLLVVSALSFRDLARPDMLVYGRYVEVVVPPLLAISLARVALSDRPLRVGAAVGVVAAATVVVAALRIGIRPPNEPNRWNVAALPFLTLRLGWPSIVGAGVVASAAVLVFAEVARRKSSLLPAAVLAAFAAITLVVEHNPILSGQESVYPADWTSPGKAVNTHSLAYDRGRYDVIGLYVYQWFMPHTRFRLYSGSSVPDEPTILSDGSWSRRHPVASTRALWRDPGRDQEIFALAPRR